MQKDQRPATSGPQQRNVFGAEPDSRPDDTRWERGFHGVGHGNLPGLSTCLLNTGTDLDSRRGVFGVASRYAQPAIRSTHGPPDTRGEGHLRALVTGGHAGGIACLAPEECATLTTIACEQAGGRIPVIVEEQFALMR